jgi:hypothetical protein
MGEWGIEMYNPIATVEMLGVRMTQPKKWTYLIYTKPGAHFSLQHSSYFTERIVLIDVPLPFSTRDNSANPSAVQVACF